MSAGSSPRRRWLAATARPSTLLALSLGCRVNQGASTPPAARFGDVATVNFEGVPPGFHAECESGCEELAVEREGQSIILRPVFEPLQIDLRVGAPGYAEYGFSVTLISGVISIRPDLEPGD